MDDPKETVNKLKKAKIIIEGITQAGVLFRPSDWAERICGSLSTFKNQRIDYSPLLKPSYSEGHRCLILDPKLQETNPALYKHIFEFALKNKLRIHRMDIQTKPEEENEQKGKKK